MEETVFRRLDVQSLQLILVENIQTILRFDDVPSPTNLLMTTRCTISSVDLSQKISIKLLMAPPRQNHRGDNSTSTQTPTSNTNRKQVANEARQLKIV